MCRVLVADDNADQLRVYQAVLEAGGHEVALAACTSDAARHAERGAADIIVMDLKFPNVKGDADTAEGLALIRRIREGGSATPIIVLSGWPEDLDGAPEERMVSRVLVKPVGMAALLGTIRELVGQAPS
ncbi:MAG TPA: response regulator [Bryobacteraceae bacterium]|jgi:CheY-like chemotaxis protein